jgi:DNA-binding NtrC family response regulator
MQKIRVLLIDDEEELVSTLVERLDIRGVQAECVTNGTEAFARLRESSFDAAVIDLKLPGMSGIDVMKKIKSEHPEMVILLTTGHGSVSEEQEGIPPEAADVLYKPIDIEILVSKLKSSLQE